MQHLHKKNSNRKILASNLTDKPAQTKAITLQDNRPNPVVQKNLIDNRQLSKQIAQRVKDESIASRIKKNRRVKKKKEDVNDSDIEIDSDLDSDDEAEKVALSKSFKNGIVPKKFSNQMERVLDLRKSIKKDWIKKGDKSVISSTALQAILAQQNLKYSPQNTTAIGIGEEGNTIVTKMGGANANYLGEILNAEVIVEKRKSAKNHNTYHAEKALSKQERKKKFRRLIVDKKRCDICEMDEEITKSADKIID
jgi:hypothetical protein